jgi:hypothetical protein
LIFIDLSSLGSLQFQQCLGFLGLNGVRRLLSSCGITTGALALLS